MMLIRSWSKYSCQVRVFSIRAMSFLYLTILLLITSESYALSPLHCEALFELNKIKHKLRVDFNLHNGVRNLENVEANRQARHKIKFTALINDPKFVDLVQSLAPEYQEATLNAAKYFSLDQLIAIAIEGQGFQWLQLKRRCPHCCIGCAVQADNNNSPSKTMKWEDFTNALYALTGLEDVLNKSEYHLNILKKKSKQQASKFITIAHDISPFWDSEPTATILIDKFGNKHGVYEILKTIYAITGKRAPLITTGWNPNGLIEADMNRIVKDILNNNDDYLSNNGKNGVYFQIKLVAQPFIDEFNAFLYGLLKDHVEFQKQFSKDFKAYKLDFQKYHNKQNAYYIYESILMANIDKLIQNSKYLMDRIKNIQTLMPIITSKKTKIIFVTYYNKSSFSQTIDTGLPSSILPLIEKKRIAYGITYGVCLFKNSFKKLLFAKINELYLDLLLQNDHILDNEWKFNLPVSSHVQLGTGIVFVDGGIGFTGKPANFLNAQFADIKEVSIPQVSGLFDQPVFSDSKLPQPRIFQLAYNRIITTRQPRLTNYAIEDIKDFLQEQYLGQKCIVLESFVSRYHRNNDIYDNIADETGNNEIDGTTIKKTKKQKKEILAVPVKIEETQYLFSLRTGDLYDPAEFGKDEDFEKNRPSRTIKNL